ncbi:MAG: 16S rRNA (uracil(1498)-N(3))-methyltransferase [Hespellia sp.]|nr:16S rRNA (uracil(1498)-N(3))-methyltransferase [Hespellia sp.]
MHHFFVTNEQVEEDQIHINGADVNHICNVLRMQTGDELEISDGTGREYVCQIREIAGEEVILTILQRRTAVSELPSRVCLIQGLPKGDKMDLIVQKAVELGVSEIIPVEMKRTVVKLDVKKAEKKKIRWNRIAEGAAKQSKRGIIPKVEEVLSFAKALERVKEMEVLLIPYECAEDMKQTRRVMEAIRPGDSIAIWIGPEGGFEEEEIRQMKEHGGVPITLGHRILRTETAGLAMLSILMYHLER